VLPVVLLAAGCQRSGAPELAPVTGVVTLDGKPLADALIAFEPDDGPTASIAWTDENGTYDLEFKGGLKGALLGTHKVIVSKPEGEEGESTEALPARYNSESTLTREVKPGKNVFNIDLTSD
jgi:hypothetical protein